MRLFDQLKRMHEFSQFDLHEAVLVRADNIVHRYYEEEHKIQTFGNMPASIAPPFEDCFIETLAPASVFDDVKGERIDWPREAAHAWGIRVRAFQVTEEMLADHDMPTAEARAIQSAGLKGWLLHIYFFCQMAGRAPQLIMAFVVALDKEGRVQRDPECPPIPEVFTTRFNPKCGISLEQAAVITGSMINMAAVCMLAFAFFNCKNVETTIERPAGKEAERHAKRRDPLTKYYTLRINPLAARSSNAASNGAGSPRSFHIVRGHFKTFTEERPLFGRRVGTFWVPQHAAGSREHGEIVKDYEIGGRS